MGNKKKNYAAVANHGPESEGVQNSIGLLISILVRYPEIGTVRYNPERKTMKFTFILKEPVDKKQFLQHTRDLRQSLMVLADLLQVKMQTVRIDRHEYNTFTLFEVERDVQTLSREEISLLANFMGSRFGEALLTEENEPLPEEEKLFQDEMIQNMLEDLREARLERGLIGFREEGRVFVFNKAEAVDRN